MPVVLSKTMRSCIQGETPWPLFVFGPPGVGKTSGALYLLDRAAGATEYFPLGDLVERVANAKLGRLQMHGMNTSYRITTTDLWQEWAERDACVLDEIGMRDAPSDHECETLKMAIERRYAKPLVVVSNHAPQDLCKIYDDRIMSRLCEGTILLVEGKDRRLAGKR